MAPRLVRSVSGLLIQALVTTALIRLAARLPIGSSRSGASLFERASAMRPHLLLR